MEQLKKEISKPEEKKQTPPVVEAKPLPDTNDVEDKIDKAISKVKVIHGANDEDFEIAGKTVSYVRENLGPAFNIPPEAVALVDGTEVTEETVLKSNQVLEFIKTFGTKGVKF